MNISLFKAAAAAMVIGMCTMTSMTQAAPLGIAEATPDIYSSYVGLYYTASTQTMVVTGGADQLQYAVGNVAIIGGDQELDMTVNIDNAGNALGGSFTILGTVSSPELTSTTSTLLTGTLAPGGFAYSGLDSFYFLFNVTGGDAAPIMGSQVGMILTANFLSSVGTDFTGSFASDFSNVAASGDFGDFGTIDTVAIPEPASVALLGLAGVVALRRKR